MMIGSEVGFIDDGYTVEGYFARVPGLHPALRFTYRPMDAKDRGVAIKDLDKGLKSINPKKSEITAAEILAKRIDAWDLVYPEGHAKAGEVVEINPENLMRVQPTLADKLWATVVMGKMASDEDDSRPDQKPLCDEEQAEIDAKN